MSTEPIANVVATLEPETAAKIMQVSTQVAANPPCTPPTTDFANSTSRREIPPVSIRLPARMKKGIAASGNLLIEAYISLTEISILMSEIQIPTSAATPIDTATEIESAKQRHIVIRIVRDMTRLCLLPPYYCAVSSSLRLGSNHCARIASTENIPPTGIAA